ncbi:survival motor neuron protein-like isoform X2 [Clupea harengus]|uniref:Survival motor neuron protein-like isoform X2 n=1 Tax=Clupea harengus TaxID=7950 RepID=A0A6P3VQJ7_CLUHA|nr:survival motor neuron protein-like isoform X2 [Clupea harengus]
MDPTGSSGACNKLLSKHSLCYLTVLDVEESSKMAHCSEAVVFRRDDAERGGPASFAEDDSALVKAYDSAVRSVQAQQSGEDSGDGKQDDPESTTLQANTPHKEASDASQSASKRWTVGSSCRCMWSEDELVYPAVVLSLDGERCRVQFEGYGNEEDVDLSALLPAIPEQPWRERRWALGSHCRAVWSEDGLVYPGVVVWVKGEQCRVRFDVYENEEELELCALLPPEESQTEDEADNQDQEETPGDGSSSNSSDWRRKDGKAKGTKIPEKSRHGFTSSKHQGEEEGKKTRSRGGAGHCPPFPFPPPGMSPMGLPDAPMFPPPPPPAFTWPAGKAGVMGCDEPEDDVASLSSMLLSWYLCGYHTGYYMGLQQANMSLDMDTKKKKRVNGMEYALKTEE